MKPKQEIATLAVVVLLIATVYGLFRTRGQPNTSPTSVNSPMAERKPVPWWTKARCGQHAGLRKCRPRPEERQVAEDALHIADKEMDLAFATAVREAEQHPPAMSAEAKEIQTRLQKSENAVAADQAKVAQLTAEDAKASGSKKDELDDELDLAKAQLELDQDEVDDGKEDLDRAGGDQQARIQALTARARSSFANLGQHSRNRYRPE